MTEPSDQVVAHANSNVMRQRVVAVLKIKDAEGVALSPAVEPTAEVIDRRWDWAIHWQNMAEVTDNHIAVAVMAIWPPEPAE